MDTPCEKGSPLWLENRLGALISRAENWILGNQPENSANQWAAKAWPWLLSLGFLGLWYVTPRFPIPQGLDFGGRAPVVPLTIGIALFMGCIRETRWGAFAKEAICIAISLLLYIFLTAYFRGPWELRSVRLFLELVLPLALFALPVPPRYQSWKITCGFLLLLLVPLSSALYEFNYLGRNASNRLAQVRYLIPVMLPLMAWMAVQTRVTWMEWTRAAAILLSPAQILSKTALLPDYMKLEPGARTRLKGLLLVLVGSVHIWIMVAVFSEFVRMESRAPQGLLDFIYLGFTSYLRFYFFVYGAAGLTRGLFFLAGWKVPPFFNFALLAATPQDRWRRWDIPVYLTYRLFIFLPVFRRTRSLFLGIFLTFMVVASSYIFQPVFLLLGRGWAGSLFTIEKIYLFYALQAVFVYAGILSERFWPSPSSRRGWWGILLTTLLMSVCYGVRHLPLKWFKGLL